MDLGIGVIGTGVMGADHARTVATLTHGARLAAVSDADRDRAEAVARDLGGAKVHGSALSLIDDPAVEAVIIASPDATHVELSLACLSAGKPVLCEKPLAPTIEGCLSVIEAEVARGERLVQVGFMRRFDPGYRAMKATRLSGDIGPAVILHCAHRNAAVPPWFDGTMVITNSAVHEIDIARWLLDDEIAAATLFMRCAEGGPPDRQFMVLETAGGVIVDVELHLNAAYGYDVRAELVCETGTIALSPQDPVRRRTALEETLRFAPDWRAHFRAAYTLQMQAFVDGAARRRLPGATAWDGYAAIATAEACLTALGQGGTARVAMVDKPPLYVDTAA